MTGHSFTLLALLSLLFAAPAAAQEHDHSHHAHSDVDAHGHDEVDAHAPIEISADDQDSLGVKLATAGPVEMHPETVLPGEVKLNRDALAYVGPRYGGVVREIRKRLGDEVRKGDVLAVLESNESLTNFEVTAPITGTIIEYKVTLGESVESNSRLFSVADLSTLWVDLDVYQKDLSAIAKGQPVHIDAGHHLQGAEGKISYVSPVLDEHTRTGLARVVLDNKSGAWKPGMFVTGYVLSGETHVPLAVTAGAIQRLDAQPVVFVQTAEGFEPRPVKLGRSDGQWVEVLQGIEPGERYVSDRSFVLKAQKIKSTIDPHAGHSH